MPINHKDKREIQKNAEKEKKNIVLSEPLFSFDDIIVNDSVIEKIENALALEEHRNLIYETWNLGSVIKQKRSFSVNLFGPSGTGKTMLAHAIAKRLNKKLIIVDYSAIESKYVGETAKNIVELFEYAKGSGTILLFDEADALLSKRVTSMNNATDVSVNQTRNVLLQLLDSYSSPVIFTTNYIENYDKAFYRRISHQIELSYPDKKNREKLWEHYLLDTMPLAEERTEIIKKIVDRKSITGADIANIVLKLAVECARGKIDAISVKEIIIQLDELERFKLSADGYEIETRKVSKEYAEKIIHKGEADV